MWRPLIGGMTRGVLSLVGWHVASSHWRDDTWRPLMGGMTGGVLSLVDDTWRPLIGVMTRGVLSLVRWHAASSYWWMTRGVLSLVGWHVASSHWWMARGVLSLLGWHVASIIGGMTRGVFSLTYDTKHILSLVRAERSSHLLYPSSMISSIVRPRQRAPPRLLKIPPREVHYTTWHRYFEKVQFSEPFSALIIACSQFKPGSFNRSCRDKSIAV